LSLRPCVGGIFAAARSAEPAAAAAVARGRSGLGGGQHALLPACFRRGVGVAVGVLELLGGGEMALRLPDISGGENFRDAGAGLPWLSAVCSGMLCDVRYRVVAIRMEEAGDRMKRGARWLLALAVASLAVPLPALAEKTPLP